MITLLAIVASLAAVGFALLAWRQHRDAVRRSTARVAALTAAIDGHEPAFAGAGPARSRRSGAPSRRWRAICSSPPTRGRLAGG